MDLVVQDPLTGTFAASVCSCMHESAGCLSGSGTCSNILPAVFFGSPLVQFGCVVQSAQLDLALQHPLTGTFAAILSSTMCESAAVTLANNNQPDMLQARSCSSASRGSVLFAQLRLFTRRRSRRAPATWRLAFPDT